jgi:hypothetical protein
MSVVKIVYDPTFDVKRRGSLGAAYNRERVRYFRAYTDDPSDSDEVVLAEAGAGILPARGDTFIDGRGNADPYAICQHITATESDDPQKWLVEALYTSEATEIAREDVDPLLEAPKVVWGTEVVQQYSSVDINSVPIQSSAGELYPGGHAKERRIRTLKITRNEAVFDIDQADQFQETVNLDPIWGYQPGMVWLYEINSPDAHKYRSGVTYAEVQYCFKMDREIVDPATNNVLNNFDTPGILDQGLYQLKVGTFLREPIREGADPITLPRALDGKGRVAQRSVTDGIVLANALGIAPVSLQSATAAFTPADLGATVFIQGAGVGGTQLRSTITHVYTAVTVDLTPEVALAVNPAVVLIAKPPAYLFPQDYPAVDWTALALPDVP